MFDDIHYTAQLFYKPYVRIVTCIVQVNMQTYWNLPKPSNYSHDVLQSFYLRIKKRVACLYGVIMHDGGMLGEYERSL